MSRHVRSTVPVAKSNLRLTLYNERGKREGWVKGHNIFLTLGRSWLPDLISYSSLPAGDPTPVGPVTRTDSRGVRYMGLGMGGDRQSNTALANASPLVDHYPGTNEQTDTDPAVSALERPVRISAATPGSPALPPTYDAGDVWLGQIAAPPVKPNATSVRFSRLFNTGEVAFGPFTSVPIAEIGLFLHSDSATYIHTYNNPPFAYDTFDTFHIRSGFGLLVEWELRF